MNKTIFFSLLATSFLLTSCANSNPETSTETPVENTSTETHEATIVDVSEEGYTTFNEEVLNNTLTSNSNGLTAVEEESLLYMREEEKLAHDLYLDLYELWGQKSFNNIAQSESSHMAAVKSLLDLYDLEDPMTDNGRGVFENPELQALYDRLKAQGETSLVEALKVGAIVEEVDIVDLETALQNTSNENIILVYENLIKGSENHLRAFVKQLDRQGVDYSPAYLEEAVFKAII